MEREGAKNAGVSQRTGSWGISRGGREGAESAGVWWPEFHVEGREGAKRAAVSQRVENA
jgi:hypothetical protein